MKNLRVLLVLTFLLFLGSNVSAQLVTGHYGPGLFGLRSAGGFPTGWSYVNVTHFYYAGEYKDNDGKISTLSKPVNVIANISTGIWGTNIEKINAKYNAAVVLPVTNLALNPENLDLDPEKVGIGDVYVIPAMLTWNFDRVLLNTRYGIWLPVGSYKAGSKNNHGKGFWSHNLGLGATFLIDNKKTWHISAMGTFEFNSKLRDTEITPGSALVVEWGIGKTFNNSFNMGIVGYNTRQVSKQKGVTEQTLNNYSVNGLGMEFSYRTQDKWAFITRWYLEYLAANRPEGSVIRFIMLKNF